MRLHPLLEFRILGPSYDCRRHFRGRIRAILLDVRNAESGPRKGRPETLILLRIAGNGFVSLSNRQSRIGAVNSNVGKGTQDCLFLAPEWTARSGDIRGQKAQNCRYFLRRDAFCKVKCSDFMCGQSFRESRQQWVIKAGCYASESASQPSDRSDLHDQVSARRDN